MSSHNIDVTFAKLGEDQVANVSLESEISEVFGEVRILIEDDHHMAFVRRSWNEFSPRIWKVNIIKYTRKSLDSYQKKLLIVHLILIKHNMYFGNKKNPLAKNPPSEYPLSTNWISTFSKIIES